MANDKIRVGKATAKVKLIKVSAEKKEARHETRRVGEEPPKPPVTGTATTAKPFTGEFPKIKNDTEAVSFVGATGLIDRRPTEQGVHDPDGGWVNLTERLKEIDRSSKLDAMEVEFTIDEDEIPTAAIRGSFYIAPAEAGADEFLSYIWHGVATTGLAAIVRYSKTTKQYLGAIMAGDTDVGPCLVLHELEWPENMREFPEAARLFPDEVSAKGQQIAMRAMSSLRADPNKLQELKDERAGQRADLLTAARAGRALPQPPRRESTVPDDLSELLTSVGE